MLCSLLCAAVLAACSSVASAGPIPTWAIEENLLWDHSGNIGGFDTDVAVPNRHAILGGKIAGQEWFALADSELLNLTSWEGFQEPNLMVGFMDIGVQSGTGFTFLFGNVQSDGGIYVCISGVNDTACDRTVWSPGSTYGISIYLKPESVPEPSALILLCLGFLGLGRISRSSSL